MISPSTILGLGAPFTVLCLHILVYRIFPALKNFPRQKLAVIVILVTTVITIGQATYLGMPLDQIIHAGLLSLMLGYSYFHFFNMSETARRIRILVAYVAKIPHKDSGYDAGKIYGNRMVRLREHNMIYETDGKLMVRNGPMVWASYLIMFWRKLFYPS